MISSPVVDGVCSIGPRAAYFHFCLPVCASSATSTPSVVPMYSTPPRDQRRTRDRADVLLPAQPAVGIAQREERALGGADVERVAHDCRCCELLRRDLGQAIRRHELPLVRQPILAGILAVDRAHRIGVTRQRPVARRHDREREQDAERALHVPRLASRSSTSSASSGLSLASSLALSNAAFASAVLPSSSRMRP